MFVALNWKTLKPTLPDMPAASIMFVISANVAREQPLHELAQRGLVRRFKNEVKMIRHQAESEYFYPMTFLRFSQERKESFVVLRFVEYRGATVATINYVVRISALLSSGNSRH